MWHVATESKIQLVNCELSPKFPLGHVTFGTTRRSSDLHCHKARASGDLDNRRTKRTPRKCFRCGSEDHLISKYLNPQKDNKKL